METDNIIYPIYGLWLGKYKMKTSRRITLNIVIPLLLGGLCFAISESFISETPEGGALSYCIGLLTALFIAAILLLTQKENEADVFAKIKTDVIQREHYTNNVLENADHAIAKLIEHLAKDCYDRCSNKSIRCKDCERYNQRVCSGLLREYLLETCKDLSEAIVSSREGKFTITTNEDRFHILATDHLINFEKLHLPLPANELHYSVVHWIGHEKLKEKKYDFLDYYFLNNLIERIAMLRKKEPLNYQNFKIRWLLIGDEANIMNSYDYIFYTIDFFMKNHNSESNLKINDLDNFFEFYVISANDYRRHFNLNIKLIKGEGEVFYSKKEPNLGLFGDYFMFAEGGKEGESGTIYTNQYKNDSLRGVLSFFESIITAGVVRKMKYSYLYKEIYRVRLSDEYREKELPARFDDKK